MLFETNEDTAIAATDVVQSASVFRDEYISESLSALPARAQILPSEKSSETLNLTDPYTEKVKVETALNLMNNGKLNEYGDGRLTRPDIFRALRNLNSGDTCTSAYQLEKATLLYLKENFLKIQSTFPDFEDGKGITAMDLHLFAKKTNR